VPGGGTEPPTRRFSIEMTVDYLYKTVT